MRVFKKNLKEKTQEDVEENFSFINCKIASKNK
jgi:hypothetical protein